MNTSGQTKGQRVSEAGPRFGDWRFFHDIPAWGISLFFHIGVILVLMSVTFVIDQQFDLEMTAEVTPEEIAEEEYVISTEIHEEIGSLSSLNIAGPSLASAQQSGFDNHMEPVDRITEQLLDARLQIPETLQTPNEADVMESIDLTGTTEHAGGTEGAIDRITQEIAASLRRRKTLVVWLLDESLSMEKRREAVAKRFENIYRQLGAMDVGAEDALRTGLIGFGRDVHVLLGKPTADIGLMTQAVKSIRSDVSGEERVFTALNKALQVFLPARRKMEANMMMILVTDERGDDYALLEKTVRRCAREGVKTYCIGNTSVFGREKGYIKTRWEADGDSFEEYLPADMGPETVTAEGLQLPFWNVNGRELESLSAGYGPYTLSRLCSETGGIFFVAEDANRQKWDTGIMRKYLPDYRPLKDYQRQLTSNAAKAALVRAGGKTLANGEEVPIPAANFQANNDNVLRQQITEAQKPLATLDYYLQELASILERGESDRDKLDSDRWRASYDLAMGRVLAMRVRALGYNAMLADMKSSPMPFSVEGNNRWDLRASDDINAGASVRRLHKKAVTYLQRVLAEHPGTPWAFQAQVELNSKLGWEWQEGRMFIPELAANTPQNRPQFAPEEEMRREERRRRQQKQADTRPKL